MIYSTVKKHNQIGETEADFLFLPLKFSLSFRFMTTVLDMALFVKLQRTLFL